MLREEHMRIQSSCLGFVLFAAQERFLSGQETALVSQIDGPETMFSELFACPLGHMSFEEFAPRTFSFVRSHHVGLAMIDAR